MEQFKDQPSIPHSIGQDEITAAFREVFSTASGKRVLFWMLEQCAIYGEAYAGELERDLLGSSMFTEVREQRGREGTRLHRLFAARAFSVSRLAIAVADAVTLAWLGAIAAIVPWRPVSVGSFALGAVAVTAIALAVIVRAARSTAVPPAPPNAHRPASRAP